MLKALNNLLLSVVMIFESCAFSYAAEDLQQEFIRAIKNNDVKQVQGFINNKIEIDPECKRNKMCKPLSFAAQYGNIEIVKMLIDAGAKINAKGAYGDTAYMGIDQASVNGKTKKEIIELKKYFLNNGLDVNQQNEFGISPFIILVKNSDIELLSLALEKGANVNAQGFEGMTPLMFAIQENKPLAISWLLKNGADPRIKDEKSMSAMDYATATKQELLIKSLDEYLTPKAWKLEPKKEGEAEEGAEKEGESKKAKSAPAGH